MNPPVSETNAEVIACPERGLRFGLPMRTERNWTSLVVQSGEVVCKTNRSGMTLLRCHPPIQNRIVSHSRLPDHDSLIT